MPPATPYPGSYPYGEIKKSPLRTFGRWFCVSRFRITIVSAGFLLVLYFLCWFLPTFLYNKSTSKKGIVVRPFEVVLDGKASPETGNLLASLLALELQEKKETLAYELSRIQKPSSLKAMYGSIFLYAGPSPILPTKLGLAQLSWLAQPSGLAQIKDASLPASHYERAAKGYLMGLGDVEFKPWGFPIIRFFFELERIRKREIPIAGIFSRNDSKWDGAIQMGTQGHWTISSSGDVNQLAEELAFRIILYSLQSKKLEGEASEFKKLRWEDFREYYKAICHLKQFLEEEYPHQFPPIFVTASPELLEARDVLNKLIGVVPQSALLHNSLGTVYYYLNERKEAEEEFKIAKNLNSKYHSVRHNMAVIYIDEARYSLAEKELGEARNLDPSAALTALLLADLYQTQGELKKAIEVCERYKKDSALVCSRLGELYAQTGKYKLAIRVLEQGVKLGGDRETANKRLDSLWYICKGKPPEKELARLRKEEEELDKEFKDAPGNDTAMDLLEVLCYQQKWGEAEKLCKKVGREYPELKIYLGHLYSSVGKKREARDIYRESIKVVEELNPFDASMVARFFYEIGEPEEAHKIHEYLVRYLDSLKDKDKDRENLYIYRENYINTLLFYYALGNKKAVKELEPKVLSLRESTTDFTLFASTLALARNDTPSDELVGIVRDPYIKGIIAKNQQKLNEAITSFSKGLEEETSLAQTAEGIFSNFSMWEEQGDINLEERRLELLKKFDPKVLYNSFYAFGRKKNIHPIAKIMLGDLYMEERDYNAALESYGKVETDPEISATIKALAKKRKDWVEKKRAEPMPAATGPPLMPSP